MKLHARGAAVVLLALAAVCLSPPEARACSCVRASPCEYAAKASFVFAGTVTATGFEQRRVDRGTADGPQLADVSAASVSVEEVFIGAGEPEVRIYGTATTCDYNFRPGGRYLIYASVDEDGQALFTHVCSGTKALSQAGEDLGYLRDAQRLAAGGAAFGEVSREDTRAGETGAAPLAGVRVIFERGGRSYSAATDALGAFELSGLPPGRYSARHFDENMPARSRADAGGGPAGAPEEPRSEWLVDVPARGCVRLWFLERPEGEVSGEVSGLVGVPRAEVEVHLLKVDAGAEGGRLLASDIDSEGRFKFNFVPPGRYYLGFNLSTGPSLDSPFAETYYPAGHTRGEAQPISVGPGQKLRGLSLTMAPRIEVVEVSGVAVWPDGRPAAGVKVELINPRTGSDVGDGAPTDRRGRFRVRCLAGQTYYLSAVVRKGTSLVYSKRRRLTARQGSRPVRLVVELPGDK